MEEKADLLTSHMQEDELAQRPLRMLGLNVGWCVLKRIREIVNELLDFGAKLVELGFLVPYVTSILILSALYRVKNQQNFPTKIPRVTLGERTRLRYLTTLP